MEARKWPDHETRFADHAVSLSLAIPMRAQDQPQPTVEKTGEVELGIEISNAVVTDAP